MMADASAVDVALNAAGDATAVWIESTALGSHINASHYVAANAVWSQKELIAEVVNADGTIQALTTGLDGNNVNFVLWGTKQTDGVNDTLQMWRNSRLTAISDATTGNGTNPGGGTGTGTGAGTTDPGAGGNTIPESANWTTPVLASQMMHHSANFGVYGPQVVLDDIGGTSIRMAMASYDGTSLTSIGNHIVRSVDNSNWQDILVASGLFSDLSNSALMESISTVPATGNLYGLIRDDAKRYLARYLPNVGWGKLEIPDVPATTSSQGLHLTTNDAGMVTIAWHQISAVCCTVDIHAKHFAVATNWQATETITVPAQAVLSPHVVDSDGNVHVAWLIDNPDMAQGGFNMKMAAYTPMAGWSPIIDGPSGLKSALVKTSSSGNNKVVVVTDQASGVLDAYVVSNDGSWTAHANINQKVSGDGVTLLANDDVQVIAGGADHFMVAWRESAVDSNGVSEVRYRTAMIHYMTDATSGMSMWHVEAPSQVGGMNSEIERNLNFVLDTTGKAYAVWTSVDSVNNTDNVYVNQAAMAMGAGWPMMPELLASYDMSAGNYAEHASITINSLGNVGIAWDQHKTGSGMAMHDVWFVKNK
jgi:hypothetical protein